MPFNDISTARSDKGRDIALAALEQFTLKGFLATSLETIAVAAGIGKSTIYEYYKNKEELYMAAVREASEEWFRQLALVAEQTTDPVEQLERIGYYYLECDDSRTIPSQRFYFEVLNQTIMEGGVFYTRRHFIHKLHQKIIAGIVDILLSGVSRGLLKAEIAREAHKIAVTYLAFLDGLTLYALADAEYIDLPGQVAFFMRYLTPTLRLGEAAPMSSQPQPLTSTNPSA